MSMSKLLVSKDQPTQILWKALIAIRDTLFKARPITDQADLILVLFQEGRFQLFPWNNPNRFQQQHLIQVRQILFQPDSDRFPPNLWALLLRLPIRFTLFLPIFRFLD